MNKRGISPLIASILLIVFVLVIAVLVMSWTRKGVETQMAAGEIQSTLVAECAKTTIDLSNVDRDKLDSKKYYLIVNNIGSTAITKLQVVAKGASGTQIAESATTLSKGESKSVSVTFTGDPGVPQSVEVIPVIAQGTCEAGGATTTNIRVLT